MTDYADFLARKAPVDVPTGHDVVDAHIHPRLFPFQRAIVRWALRRGRAACFLGTGMGKTGIALEWAAHVPGPVLILTPLAVAEQFVEEAAKLGRPVAIVADQAQADASIGSSPCPIYITNYEKLHKFSPGAFVGVVLDESGILKAYDGKTRTAIIEAFARTPYKLACTATPAPNDHMELGNHAEFLGAMSRTEMLSSFFVHDGETTSEWRLKGHARKDFWRWVCSWAVAARHPRDLGMDQAGYDLPSLEVVQHVVQVEVARAKEGMLFALDANTLAEQQQERKATIAERVGQLAELIRMDCEEKWLVWCDLNDEQDEIERRLKLLGLPFSSIRGSTPEAKRIELEQAWRLGDARVLVSKGSIFGFGMNWQHCARMAFVGVSHSFEQFYQAARRCWRFGQTRPVQAHVITASTEGRVVESLRRKEADYDAMMEGMLAEMTELEAQNLKGITMMRDDYATDKRGEGRWTMHLGDCVEGVRALADESIDYSVFSPPFASLYTYSALDRDMGNCKDIAEFSEHFAFLVPELLRVTKPGRLLSFHCMNLPTSKVRDGVIGLSDFRGELIRMFVAAGWIYHSEVVIWKDPVTAMQRTKALGLLHKQIKKDSAMSRQGIPDYLVTMRKPGENASPITHTGTGDDLQVSEWQELASPVWMDIAPSDTLQHRSARESEDEKHICPLQLEVIERALKLWTKEGDLVLSPFAGIGSEGHVALLMGRRFVGFELKRSYYEQACRNLDAAAGTGKGQRSILDLLDTTSDDGHDAQGDPAMKSTDGALPSGSLPETAVTEAPSPVRRESGAISAQGGSDREDGDGPGPGKVREADSGSTPDATAPSLRAAHDACAEVGTSDDTAHPEASETSPDSLPPNAESDDWPEDDSGSEDWASDFDGCPIVTMKDGVVPSSDEEVPF